MDDRPYFYRVRGRTLGPVGLRQIRQLAQRAQIGRTTDVSRDALQWGKAGDWPEIFDTGGDVTPSFDMGGFSGGLGDAPSVPSIPDASPPRWYYSIAGIQKGPVDFATLQQMVASGKLSSNDHVFPEGGSDWMTVGSVSHLSGVGNSVSGAAPVVNVTVPQPQPEGTNGLAIAGFILSLVGCAPLGFILCLVALNGKNQANRGLAIAGAIIGGLLTLCGCGYVVLVMMAAVANR